jgi:hypothetical protein
LKHRVMATIGVAILAGMVGTSAAGVAQAAPRSVVMTGAPLAAAGLRYVAQAEGVSVRVLVSDLRQGQTLLQIAGSKYSSAADLATALLARVKSRLDTAAGNGTISVAQESQIYAKRLSWMTVLVTTPHPLRSELKTAAQSLRGALAKARALVAGACTTTPSALTTVLRAGGTSVLAACRQTNPAETQAALTAVLFAPIQARLQNAEQSGLLTTTQEAKLGARVQTVIGKAITRTLPARPA